jgi:hypothetical protein
MTNLSTLLSAQGAMPYMKWILLGIVCVLGLIGFIYGALHGVREIGWGGFVWALLCVAFVFLNKALHSVVPVKAFGFLSKLTPEAKNLIATGVIAVSCALLILIIFGFFRFLSIKKPKITEKNFFFSSTPIENRDYSPLGEEFDYEYENEEKMKEGYEKDEPKFLSRLSAGVISMTNVLVTFATIAVLALLILHMTPLGTGTLKDFYAEKYVDVAYKFSLRYALDFFLIGILALYIRRGWRVGVVSGFRGLIGSIGRIALIVLAFWLPFMGIANGGGVFGLVGKLSGVLSNLASKFLGSFLNGGICDIIGKVACGIVLCVLFLLLIWLVLWLLDRVSDTEEENGFISFVDGVIAALVYIVVGVVVCGLIVTALYLLATYTSVSVKGGLFSEDSTVIGYFFETCEYYVSGLIDKIKAKVS